MAIEGAELGRIKIHLAEFPQDTEELVALIHEYFSWLELPYSHRGFAEEISALELHYTLPSGCVLVAEAQGEMVGCVALQRKDSAVAEIKRFYVRPGFRGQKLGEWLMRAIIEKAEDLEYSALVLGAIPKTVAAQHLYIRLGFSLIPAFYEDPVAGTRFYQLKLTHNR